MSCNVPKLILVTKLESFCQSPHLPLLGERAGDAHTGTRVCIHAHTHEPWSSTNKVAKLVRTNEEVPICTVLSYKQTIIMPFGENASVPRSSSGKLASGWIKSSSELGLRWSVEAGFQTPPWKAFQKQTLCFIYKNLTVSLPGPSDWFFFLVKGLFDDCFYSPIKPPWSSVCKS